MFGYLFKGYKEEAFYWEFIKIFLRFILRMIFDLMVKQKNIKQIFTATILILYCVVIAKVKPYSKKFDFFNRYDLGVNLVLFCTVYSELIMKVSIEDKKIYYFM